MDGKLFNKKKEEENRKGEVGEGGQLICSTNRSAAIKFNTKVDSRLTAENNHCMCVCEALQVIRIRTHTHTIQSKTVSDPFVRPVAGSGGVQRTD